MEVKPVLKILGDDGNAFVVLSKASRIAKDNDMDWEKIESEATNGDYNHLLQTMSKYFEVK